LTTKGEGVNKYGQFEKKVVDFIVEIVREAIAKEGTQVAVAKKLNVSSSSISRWVNGQVDISYCRIDKLTAIMEALEVPMERLVEALFGDKGQALATIAKEDKAFLEKLARIIDNDQEGKKVIVGMVNKISE
jgi:transcriptional regulator with XRE-family HTH domain